MHKGRSWIFVAGSLGFRERGDKSPRAGSRDTAPVGVWGRNPQRQNLSFRCMTHRKKTVFRIYRPHAEHIFLFV